MTDAIPSKEQFLGDSCGTDPAYSFAYLDPKSTFKYSDGKDFLALIIATWRWHAESLLNPPTLGYRTSPYGVREIVIAKVASDPSPMRRSTPSALADTHRRDPSGTEVPDTQKSTPSSALGGA